MKTSAVEAYMVVKKEMMEKKSEQAFWADCTAILMQKMQEIFWRWPSHERMLEALSQSQKTVLDYSLLRQLFPQWRSKRSIFAWLRYYEVYDFLALDYKDDDDDPSDLSNEELRDVLKEELSLMLGVAPLTSAERILEHKRLSLIGLHVRERRKEDAAGQQNGPSPKPMLAGKLSEEEVRLQMKTDWKLRQAIAPSCVIKTHPTLGEARVLPEEDMGDGMWEQGKKRRGKGKGGASEDGETGEDDSAVQTPRVLPSRHVLETQAVTCVQKDSGNKWEREGKTEREGGREQVE
jgi:hypothetical protein